MSRFPQHPQLGHLPHLFGGGDQPTTFGSFVQTLAPELYLRFNGDANDSSGHARHGTTHGSPILTASGAVAYDSNTCGKFVKASSQYISIPNFTTGFTAFSFFVWVRPIALASLDASGGRVFSQRSVGGWVELFLDQNGDVMLFDGSISHTIAAAGTYTDGTWTLIGATITGAGGATCTPYVNGVAQAAVGWANNTDAGEFEVGRLQLTAGNFANFWIDELMVTQQQLTAAQHLKIYNMSKKTKVTVSAVTTGSQVAWTFSNDVVLTDPATSARTAALEINAGGLGFIAPNGYEGPVSTNGLSLDYAVANVAGNAWRVNDEPADPTFGPAFYLKTPSSGVTA